MNPLANAGHAAGHSVAGMGAWIGQHKIVLLGAGGLGAVVLALRARSAAGGTDVPTDATGASVAGYDTSGTDTYDALQPQVEQTQGLLQQLLDAMQGTQDTTDPGDTTIPPGTPGNGGKKKNPPKKKHHKKKGHPTPPATHPHGHKPPKHHHVAHTPPTKPPPHPPKKAGRLPQPTPATAGRRRAAPAPIAKPGATIARRNTTLASVARATGTPLPAIAKANRALPVAQKLKPGQRVVVPVKKRRR